MASSQEIELSDLPRVESVEGEPFLVTCARAGLDKHVAVLIRGAKKDALDAADEYETHFTALHAACDKGHVGIVEMLVNAGATVDKPSGALGFENPTPGFPRADGCTPLQIACIRGHVAVVKFLVARGANKDFADSFGRTAVFHAAANGRTEIVRELLAAGADKDTPDRNGWTPLMIAEYGGHGDTSRVLRDAGATFKVGNMDDESKTCFLNLACLVLVVIGLIVAFALLTDKFVAKPLGVYQVEKTRIIAIRNNSLLGECQILNLSSTITCVNATCQCGEDSCYCRSSCTLRIASSVHPVFQFEACLDDNLLVEEVNTTGTGESRSEAEDDARSEASAQLGMLQARYYVVGNTTQCYCVRLTPDYLIRDLPQMPTSGVKPAGSIITGVLLILGLVGMVIFGVFLRGWIRVLCCRGH